MVDLIEIGQYAEAARDQLLVLVVWLTPSLRTRREDTAMVDRGPLSWAPLHLSVENVSFDVGCLAQDTITCKEYAVTSRDGISRIEKTVYCSAP